MFEINTVDLVNHFLPIGASSLSATDRAILHRAGEIVMQLRNDKIGADETVYNAPEIIMPLVATSMLGAGVEMFGVVCLNAKLRVVSNDILYTGDVSSAAIPVGTTARHLLGCNARFAVIYHNHPTGVLEPSQSDYDVTRAISKACDAIGVDLLDHIIVSAENCLSMASTCPDFWSTLR